MTIIERILESAEKRNITQADIAKKLKKGTAQISSWKNRNCNPPAEYMPQIAELLGVSLHWLMTGTYEEDPEREIDIELQELYKKLSEKDKNEIKAIMKMKIDAYTPVQETKIINSKIG